MAWFGCGAARREKREVHLIHFNDVYNLEPMEDEDPIGGASRFATVVKQVKEYVSPAAVLTVFGGDFVGPSQMSSFTQGAHLIEALNLIGVDYATFGNHEFDYGYQSLKNRLEGHDDDAQPGEGFAIDYPKTTATWLATNMSEGQTGLPVGGKDSKRQVIKEVDGVKVGLMGISENWLKGCSQLRDGEIVYEDYVEAARRTAAELRAQGAEVVLALTHNRLESDKKLTAEVPGIDLLLGGHDHFYKRAERAHRIIKGGQEWKWVTHIVVELGELPGEVKYRVERYDVDEDVAEDPAMKALIEKYAKIAQAKFSRHIIPSVGVVFDATEACVRAKEGTLPNWVCDAIAEDYSEAHGLQAADFSLLPGFTFAGKKEFPAGAFTTGDLMCVFPTLCTISVLKLKGSDVIKTLRLGCQSLPSECGGLFHCSHQLTYTILVKYSTEMNAVTDVKVNGAPIDEGRYYTVAVTAATAAGKYGYDWMKTAERIVGDEEGMQIQDVLLMWCKRWCHEHAGETLSPKLGRITITLPKS